MSVPEFRSTARAPYGRTSRAEMPAAPYRGDTYYERPAIKSSYYGHRIASYFFLGGLAGASQVIATIADLVARERDRSTVRAGRYLALAGAVVGPALLIVDLHTPRRWYNMFRIARRTSPLSIGTWTLLAFGTLSALTAAAQSLGDATRRPFFHGVARWIGVPAAVAGGVTSVYTGTLLASTSVPLWAVGETVLPALFGAAAASTATAAMTLARGSRARRSRPLERLARVATGVELLISVLLEARWRRRGLASPITTGPVALAYRAGGQGLGMLVPLAVHATNVRTRRASTIAAVATLAGGYLLRAALVLGGNASARRPRDYFRWTQPQNGIRPR